MNISQPLKRGDLHDALIAYAQVETRAGRIDAMSLRAAARDLGVSSGAVYRHFKDKDALIMAVVHLGMENLLEMFIAIRPQGHPAATVEDAVLRAYALGRTYTKFASENTTLWRMIFGRIGVLCREDKMHDEKAMEYTALDVASENIRDLYRLGALSRQPDIDDTRFVWSAIHGAADLAQSGIRLDGDDMERVADDTSRRTLLALGCAPETIDKYSPDTSAGPRATDC